jgi:hypothetical protein
LFANSGASWIEEEPDMEAFRSAFGMIRLFMPVVYCGGLLVYFLWVSGGSLDVANIIGLGPTLLGLGVVGLVFCIPLGLRLFQLFGRRPPGGPDGSDDEGFDPDAAIARYMASQRSAERPAPPPSYSAPRPAPKGSGPARPTGFGRRTS